MKTFSRLAVVAVVKVATILTTPAAAQQLTEAAVEPPASVPQREIIVSLEDRKLALVENGEVIRVYTVAVGKPSTPSPEGTFTIDRRVKNPTYSHDGKTVLPGPDNPVGNRWMGLSKRGYGIHGTNEPKSIGKAASHGCIRMARPDLDELYTMVAVGDTVRLIGHRDEETSRLFGPAEIAAPAAQPVLTANTEAAPAASEASDPVSLITSAAAFASFGRR